ncbi:MAG: N-acetylmuramic acid 6-phosphate etherase [Kosmotoga sp.]|uniref:N-acetylmuramic acid 6-phosphate etherase n=1 Tax=Kosmotoga sp. TaxID=1955248 RepID=UPI001D71944F|nr:N-acetylmuramic acid 6-phosphate etherase [Kosmotoga sp.]MBO8167448.1 N-acetylmuramic acid 6-phosphate etherase [Kosmotoga sp.]
MKEELEHLITEGINEKSKYIDRVPIAEKLRIINEEDKKIAYAVEKEIPRIENAILLTLSSLKKGGKVLYVGAGTSGRLGVVDASEIYPTFGEKKSFKAIMAGGEKAFLTPIEDAEDKEEFAAEELKKAGLNAIDTVIGITASGRTPFVLSALREAKNIGASTVAISNVPNPKVAMFADVSIEVVTGPEVLTGSTRMKAGTAQKMVLNMISTVTMIEMGRVYKNFMTDLVVTNRKLAERAIKMIQIATGIDYERAKELFEVSGRSPRIAIYMAITGSTKDKAKRKLEKAGGKLYKALGEGQ